MKSATRRPTRRTGRRRSLRRTYKPADARSFNRGYDAGFDAGTNEGFRAGAEAYRHGGELTSIIIPTRNQAHLLRQCIESIRRHTPEPHEIIVIDNGSSDGTGDYLREHAGRIRFRIEPEPLGFAGAVNQGLKLSVGRNVLILNNDTVVTERWLGNMLACLQADPERRLVGPVTNYISGTQRIDTSYGDMEEMHRFASRYNVSDPGRWEETERLTGFCVLMARSALQRIGFLDEGFRVGNCEDDDYGLRARILGMQLWIAKDTFIHHVGSVSMKSLGHEGVEEVTARNTAFLEEKWGDAGLLLTGARRVAGTQLLGGAQLYPTHVPIRAKGDRMYWLEGGVRYRIPSIDRHAAAVSLMAVRQIPYGGELTADEAGARIAAADGGANGLQPGSLVSDSSGTVFQYDGNAMRRFAGPRALAGWGLQERAALRMSREELAPFAEGLPIIAPETIVAGNL